MNGKPNILFTSTFSTPFISTDIQLLQSFAELKIVQSSGVAALLKYILHLRKTDLTFSWFASVYSSILVLLTKIFHKPSIIVIGGIDVAREKEFNYGIWNSWWKAKLVGYGIRHATKILSVDESLKQEAIRLAKYDGRNISVLHTGYEKEQWTPHGKKERIVLSVGAAPDFARVKIKGFDILFSVAEKMSDIQFIIIGISENIQKQLTIPKNVTCLPKIAQTELLKYYQRAKVYAQLSRREGMPNTLCEAMLCECIPVGADVFGIPTAIGNAGFLVDINKHDEIQEKLFAALNSDDTLSLKARQRIIQQFPIERRKEKLQTLVSESLD